MGKPLWPLNAKASPYFAGRFASVSRLAKEKNGYDDGPPQRQKSYRAFRHRFCMDRILSREDDTSMSP